MFMYSHSNERQHKKMQIYIFLLVDQRITVHGQVINLQLNQSLIWLDVNCGEVDV